MFLIWIFLSSQSPSQLNVGAKRHLKRGKKRRKWSSAKYKKRHFENTDTSTNENLDTSQSASDNVSNQCQDPDAKLIEQIAESDDNGKTSENFSTNQSEAKHFENLSVDKNDVTSPNLCLKQSFLEGKVEMETQKNILHKKRYMEVLLQVFRMAPPLPILLQSLFLSIMSMIFFLFNVGTMPGTSFMYVTPLPFQQ